MENLSKLWIFSIMGATPNWKIISQHFIRFLSTLTVKCPVKWDIQQQSAICLLNRQKKVMRMLSIYSYLKCMNLNVKSGRFLKCGIIVSYCVGRYKICNMVVFNEFSDLLNGLAYSVHIYTNKQTNKQQTYRTISEVGTIL